MTIHAIELTTRDGAQLRFDCGPDQTLLDAAAQAAILLPAQCRQGSCGACYAEATDGDFTLADHSSSALPAGAVEQGGTLLCRTFPRSDLCISLPFDQDRIGSGAVPVRQAEIVALDTIAAATVRLVLQLLPDEELGSMAEFEPGQFMELEVPGLGLRRAYSLANTGNWEGRLEFLIRLQPQGRFSTWLQSQAQVGQALTVHGPQGAFGVNANSLNARWLVAGGTGLAPMLSILRRMAEFQETQPVKLFFGVNRIEELFCLDELMVLGSQLPQLQVITCVWKPEGEWQGFTGTPAEALERDLAFEGMHPDIYLCGPPAMIDAATVVAQAAGVPPTQIISERFSAS